MEDTISIVEDEIGIVIDRDSFNFARYSSHLMYLLDRIAGNKMLYSDNGIMYQSMKDEFPGIAACVELLERYFKRKCGIILSKEEKLEKLKNLGMRVDDRIEKGVGKMCNLGDYIEAKAIKKGMEIGRESVTVRIVRIQIEKKKRTPEETAEVLDMPLDYIQKIADMLQMCVGASDLQIAEKLVDMRM